MLFWSLLCAFLFSVIRHRIEKLSREINVICAIIVVGIVLIGTLFLSGRIAWDLWTGVPADTLQRHLSALIDQAGSNLGFFFTFAPAYLVAAAGRELPDQPLFTDWFDGSRRAKITTLQIVRYPVRQTHPHPFSIEDFRALSAVFLIGLAVVVTFFVSSPTPLSLSFAILVRLSFLVSMLGVVYFQARLAFFDVILKRGVISAFLALTIILVTYLLLPPVVTPLQKTAFCVGATMFVSLAVRIANRSERALDQLIFRRPNYQHELASLSTEMAQCKSTGELATLVSTGLRQLLHTSSADYAETPSKEASAIVRIGSAVRPRGYLSLGTRNRAQSYGSEDLTFLDAVASQFTAQLETLEAQHSAQLAATAELRALRAQINPHFLFNTLNTVAQMAKDSPKIERTILNLARVFRNTLESSLHDRIPLREDLAAVRALLEIQTVRFEDKLHFAIQAPETLLDTPIPPLLIQPLVENALKHGLAPKLGGGSIEVIAEETANGIRVSVKDTGIGFNPTHTRNNVGISNVRSRIEREGGTFSLISTPGTGTTISFELKS
jgi:signal transduction histidine kinase